MCPLSDWLVNDNTPWVPASVAQLDAPSDWRLGGCGFNTRRGRQHSFIEIGHEIFSTVILSLPLIQEGQLSVSGERMCTILVNRLEDYACPVNEWLGKLTPLDMIPLGWLGCNPQHKHTLSMSFTKRKLTLSILAKIFSSLHFEIIFFFFPQKIGFNISCKLSP